MIFESHEAFEAYLRTRYFGYLEAGIDGDDAAIMAVEDAEARVLAEFISQQPEHNRPIPIDQLQSEEP